MQYIISFLEGIITFISPCLLPMLPIYISYFAGHNEQNDVKKTLKNAMGFVIGFTLVFIALGAFAASLGTLLKEYSTVVNIVTGSIVIIFGLNFLGILKIGFLNKTYKTNSNIKANGFFSSLLFGIVFSIGWTPCVGAFLGSALMLASSQDSVIQGVLMLLTYSMGLGIPFIISAVLINKLKSSFDFIKRNYNIINKISGTFLIVIGILMITGLIGKLLSILSY